MIRIDHQKQINPTLKIENTNPKRRVLHWQYLLVLILSSSSFSVLGQQTVGLFQNTEFAQNGYSLFSSNKDTYLIDNCGHVVNKWESDFNPGSSVYLLEDGNLLRTGRISGDFAGGGIGGRLEILDWESNVVWSYHYANELVHQHHDIEPLPNGNILVLAWEKKSKEEAIEAGRFPNSLSEEGVWPEHIVELEPTGVNEVNIVWEWHLWDHLIQDFDSSKSNFGVISDHPELVDINMNISQSGGGGPGNGADWIHANSIAYNFNLDQILLSSRHHHEIWVIDHSTSTEEAASHSGGISGKGGDLLYRWGNPKNYGRGSFANQKLWGQHDAKWIPDSYPNAGNIIIFNNGQNRPNGNYSSVDIIEPPIDSEGNYTIEQGFSYLPQAPIWSYFEGQNGDFFSPNISGAQPLPNGNILICEGRDGHFFEVNPDNEIVWRYVNPASGSQILTQGQVPVNNSTFRVTRYLPDYPGLENKDLTPMEPIELNPLPSDCIIFDGTSNSDEELLKLSDIRINGNPFRDILEIEKLDQQEVQIVIFDAFGNEFYRDELENQSCRINTSDWSLGVYFLKVLDSEKHQHNVLKILKN